MADRKKLYARRDAMKQGKFYIDNLLAMTIEDLHSKADIAEELAHRDIQIKKLRDIATNAVLLLGDNDNEDVVRIKCEILDICSAV